MKLKILMGLSGPDVNLAPGDITDLYDGEEAQGLIDAGIAEKVAKAPPKSAEPA